MAHISITPLNAPLSVIAAGEDIGATTSALALTEGSYPPVTYVPRRDIEMAKLIKTERQTTCPHKGVASYYSIQTAQGLIENAVWSYEDPIPAVADIAGHLAFYPDKVSLR